MFATDTAFQVRTDGTALFGSHTNQLSHSILIENLKNKYVQLLLMYLSIDFVIHFIIRYGMNEAILFGGHWMFAVPILLGWLYTRLPVRMYRILDWIIIGFFVLTATINTMEFMRSFLFA